MPREAVCRGYESAQWEYEDGNRSDRAVFNIDAHTGATSSAQRQSYLGQEPQVCSEEDAEDQEEGAGEDGEAACEWGAQDDEEADCIE